MSGKSLNIKLFKAYINAMIFGWMRVCVGDEYENEFKHFLFVSFSFEIVTNHIWFGVSELWYSPHFSTCAWRMWIT